MKTALLSALIGLLKGYRYFVSPWLGSNCRFYPSCSVYASEALQQHGVWQGGRLALWRIVRCHPWQAGGVDLVPSRSRSYSRAECACDQAAHPK